MFTSIVFAVVMLILVMKVSTFAKKKKKKKALFEPQSTIDSPRYLISNQA
jgi:hypothetical protein